MMKIFQTACFLFLLLSCFDSQAQVNKSEFRAFNRQDWIISTSASWSLYRYETVLKSNNEKDNNFALSRMYQIGAEKGILPWLSVGFKGKFNRYYTEKDSLTGTTPTVKSDDWLLFANGHLLVRKHFDLVLGMAYGLSSFVYAVNDAEISKATGNGPNFELSIQPRFTFGKHLGAYFLVSYNRLNYASLTFENRITSLPDALSLKGGGTGIGIGVFFRFGK